MLKYNGKLVFIAFMGVFLSNYSFAQKLDDSGRGFHYGADCSLLANLTHSELVATVHALNSEYFAGFCVARGVYSCADYTGLLEGFGELEDNGVLGCRFQRTF